MSLVPPSTLHRPLLAAPATAAAEQALDVFVVEHDLAARATRRRVVVVDIVDDRIVDGDAQPGERGVDRLQRVGRELDVSQHVGDVFGEQLTCSITACRAGHPTPIGRPPGNGGSVGTVAGSNPTSASLHTCFQPT